MVAVREDEVLKLGMVEAHLRLRQLADQTGLSRQQVLERAERSAEQGEGGVTEVLRDWVRGKPPTLN